MGFKKFIKKVGRQLEDIGDKTTHFIYKNDPVAQKLGIKEKHIRRTGKAIGIGAALFFGGSAVASKFGAGAATGAKAAVGTNPFLAGGAGGSTGAGFGSAAVSSATLSTASTTYTAKSLLGTIGSTVKTAAGAISTARIIADALGTRKVLPEGATLPPGYNVVGDYLGDGNLNPDENSDPSVSSDGVGFKLPSNSGFLLLALAALAITKGT